MSAKILVVDDSLTIQKVVNITLANTGYNLTSAHDEDELFNKLESSEFDLILLDFNLSENLTGYQLVKKIKEQSAKSKILVMIGTFDNVNDAELEEAGIDESIIKPFESTKFTNLCKSLVDSIETVKEESDSEDIFEDNGDEDEDWTVSTAGSEDSTEEAEDFDTDSSLETVENEQDTEEVSNSLKDEILGWGITLPDVIEAAEITRDMPKAEGIMPPKIDHSEDIEFRVNISEDEDFIDDETADGAPVSEDDLLFPEVLDDVPASSKLVSIDELKLEKDEVGFKVDDVALNTELIEEINEDSDDFWAVDEHDELENFDSDNEDNDNDNDNEIGPKLEDVNEIGPKLEDVNEIGPKLEDVNSSDVASVPVDEIVAKVKEDLREMISEIIDEKLKEISSEVVERVAWEAIPDLAESLIQSEIKALSEKIQEKHN